MLAILAGNALVVKAPRSSPLSVLFVYRDVLAPILERHGAPPGTLNLFTGNTGGILRSWVESPLVDDILFFGDSAAGLKLGQRCFARSMSTESRTLSKSSASPPTSLNRSGIPSANESSVMPFTIYATFALVTSIAARWSRCARRAIASASTNQLA